MGQDLGAVNPFPHKEMVRKHVALVPAQLLGHKPLEPAALQQLRQVGVEAEAVRQPQSFGTLAQFLLKIAQTVTELADDRFSRGQVGVKFHPSGSLDFPAILLHGSLNFLPEIGIELLHPFIKLGLRGAEDVVRIFLDKAQSVGKAASTLAFGLPERPKPGQVQMGMAHAICRQSGSVGRLG